MDTNVQFLNPYCPQEILVSNQQPDDVGCARCHGELLLFCYFGAKAFEHEDVGCHDDRDIVESHFILGLVVNHTLEKLHQCLLEQTEIKFNIEAVKVKYEAPFKLSTHLPSKYPGWPQVTKGPAGSKPAAAASL